MEDAVKLKKQLTRTRVFVFILVGLCFLLLVFACVQKLEADRQNELSHKNLMRAVELETMAQLAQTEAEHQRMISIQAKDAAEQQRRLSEEHASKSGQKLETVAQLRKELETQRKIAEQQRAIAKKNLAEAKLMEALATQSEIRAQQNVLMAKATEIAAKEALEDCERKKN